MLVRLTVLLWTLWAALAAGQAVPITGVAASGSDIPLRREVDALRAAGGPMWELYIRSLHEMYRENPSGRLSYFQIAGIHGRPYIEWNNAGRRNTNGWQGYCPHGENLFLPWHRPYIVLFEQRLVETARRLARAYPSRMRNSYIQAADRLRAPYWDWAARAGTPVATHATRVRINVPNGENLQSQEIDNPLRIYRFPQAARNGQFGAFDSGEQIYKCRSPNSYPATADAAIRGRSYRQWTYDALTRSTTYNQFASTGSSGVSLEQIHNTMHWDGSCGYQLLDADFSAFDPLFMLHHTQVDRLWALWQAMRPQQANFAGSYRGGARWQTPSGTTITRDSPLYPFYRSAGNFHTSATVANIRSFGYAYESLEWGRKSADQMRRDATALVNRLYGGGSGNRRRLLRRDGDESGEQVPTQFFAQIEVDVKDLPRPSLINLYVGDREIGNMVVMKQPESGKIYGKYALDEAPNADPTTLLEDIGKTVGGVVRELISGIRVEIIRPDGSSIPVSSVPSLKIDLENVHLEPPATDFELPKFFDEEHRAVPKKQFEGN